ncbi:unnamed protein product [Cuscuta europaea]|uniref:Uncharacterized protein n=1 Tax=Cuscuta europaea TaxID=41803 RepID=A0A9P0YVK2_CUSEU|nr:unnamed protein product [Cuscuta europaea]
MLHLFFFTDRTLEASARVTAHAAADLPQPMSPIRSVFFFSFLLHLSFSFLSDEAGEMKKTIANNLLQRRSGDAFICLIHDRLRQIHAKGDAGEEDPGRIEGKGHSFRQ